MAEEQRNLIVGFDLSNDYSQISCYNLKRFEPDSVYLSNNEGNCLIPTVLFIKEETMEWFYGEDALANQKEYQGIFIKDIIKIVKDKDEIDVYNTKVTGLELLVRFFRKTLSLLKVNYPTQTIQKLVVSVKNMDLTLINTIYKALEELNILKDRVIIQSHEVSYLYYVMNQKKDIWLNDVGLFNFDEEGITYYQMSVSKKNYPYVTLVSKKEYGKALDIGHIFVQEKYNDLDYEFGNIVKDALHKQLLTSVFLTGKGFSTEWGKETLKFLCMGRRVFKGQNLFTKGACYLAYEHSLTNKKFKDYLVISEGIVNSFIEINVYKKDLKDTISLINPGDLWYNSKKEFNLILVDGFTIDIIIKNVITKDTIIEKMELDGLVKRPEKTTGLLLKVKMLDSNTCLITVKDKGFGEIYQTTNRIWEKIISI